MGYTKKQYRLVKKRQASIGYDPLNRKYYIDRDFDGVLFRCYSIYEKDIKRYVKTKTLSMLKKGVRYHD